MTTILHIGPTEIQSYHDEKKHFQQDVQAGLAQSFKSLHSKYFYDDIGSDIFNKITTIPEYYLTPAELEILSTHKKIIADYMGEHSFNLIELGPGEGVKTNILLQQFMADKLKFRYTPIDISMKYLDLLTSRLTKDMIDLNLTPIHADYIHGLEWQSDHSHRKNFVLFLGSSIGNFNLQQTLSFLQSLWKVLHHGDNVLIGFDLKKNIKILMNAYDDTSGITRDFNLNLLKRINRELGGNFNLNKFAHYATYNVHTNAMESYLISQEHQTVQIDALEKTFTFAAIEAIHTEYSHKYDIPLIHNLAEQSGFKVINNFTDTRGFFINSLWEVNK